MEDDMIVYTNYVYKKEKIGDKKIINNIFEIFHFLGEGSFWKAYLVQRHLNSEDAVDNNFYVFKEGVLSEGSKYPGGDYYQDLDMIIKTKSIEKEENNLLEEESSNNVNINSDSETYEKRIGVKEYNILKRVNNKNIARLYECIMDSELDKIVLVMEYADLGTIMIINNVEGEEKYIYNKKLINFILKECLARDEVIGDNYELSFIKDHKILIPVASFIFSQLVEAVKYLHSKNIVHKDLKPDNIAMRSSDKNIKLLDFSHSVQLKFMDEQIFCQGNTVYFDAPEVQNFEKYNPFKADVYSLGASIYVYLFNKFDYDFSSEEVKLLKEHYPKVYSLIKNLMDSDPYKRPDINEISIQESFSYK